MGVSPETSTNGYWFYYADNGTYDVQLSERGGIPTPFTLGGRTLWDSQGAGLFDIQQFGGVPNGTTDNTAAFTAAVAAMPVGGTLILGPDLQGAGVYLITSVTILKNINIQCTLPSVLIMLKTAATTNGNQQPSGVPISFSGVTAATVWGVRSMVIIQRHRAFMRSRLRILPASISSTMSFRILEERRFRSRILRWCGCRTTPSGMFICPGSA